MTTVPTSSDDALGEVRWGMGDAVIGWLIAYGCAAFLGLLVLKATGYAGPDVKESDYPIYVIALTTPLLWVGFVGVPIWAGQTKGNGWIHDFRVRFELIDVPVGIVVGLVTQFVIVPVVAWPVLRIFHKTASDMGTTAHDLADKAARPWEIVLLFLMVAVGAPLAEELFFRGLVMGSLTKTYGVVIGVIGSALIFGATHFNALLFVPLAFTGAVFALLVVKFQRLGPAVFAHMSFNAATLVSLVGGRS